MDELELGQCLSTHALTKQKFRGVFARNEIWKYKGGRPETFIIVNTDVRSDPGTHWLLLYWTKHGLPIYFDSYGIQPVNEDIEAYLLATSPLYVYNRQRMQGDYSTVCGHYVSYVATQLCSGYTIPDIRKRFSPTNFNINDKLIITLFRKEFGIERVAYKTDRIPMSCQCLCNHG